MEHENSLIQQLTIIAKIASSNADPAIFKQKGEVFNILKNIFQSTSVSDFIETIIPVLTGSPLGSFTIFPALVIPNFDSEVVEQSRWAANWCCVFRTAMNRWSGFYCWLIESCLNTIVAMNGDEVSCEWMMFLVQSLVSKQFFQSWLQDQKTQDAIDVELELRTLNCSVNRFVTILLRSQRLEVIEFCLNCFGDCTVFWML